MEEPIDRDALLAEWDTFVADELKRLATSEFYEGIKDSIQEVADASCKVLVTRLDEYERSQADKGVSYGTTASQLRSHIVTHRAIVSGLVDKVLRT